MYRTAVIVSLLLGALQYVHAQGRARFRTGTEEGYVEGGTTERMPKSIDPAKDYHWIKGQALHVTQGGYSGRLLHGPCSAFHPGGQLREKGRYAAGVKDGAWSTWRDNGTLIAMERWRNGVLHGRTVRCDMSGREVQADLYKRGVLKRTIPLGMPKVRKHKDGNVGDEKKEGEKNGKVRKERRTRHKVDAVEGAKDSTEQAPVGRPQAGAAATKGKKAGKEHTQKREVKEGSERGKEKAAKPKKPKALKERTGRAGDAGKKDKGTRKGPKTLPSAP